MDFKKLIKDWEQLIDQYDRDANQIQKQMSEMLKSEWATNQTSLITVGKMKTIVARTGERYIVGFYFSNIIYRTLFPKS